MTDRQAKNKANRRLWETPIRHIIKEGETFWTQDGQGYYVDRKIGGAIRVDTPAPEGFLKRKVEQREKAARTL